MGCPEPVKGVYHLMTRKQPQGQDDNFGEAHQLSSKGKRDVKLLLLKIQESSNAILTGYFDRYLFPQKVMNFTRETDWKMIKWTQCFKVWLLDRFPSSDALCCVVPAEALSRPSGHGWWKQLPAQQPPGQHKGRRGFSNTWGRIKERELGFS